MNLAAIVLLVSCLVQPGRVVVNDGPPPPESTVLAEFTGTDAEGNTRRSGALLIDSGVAIVPWRVISGAVQGTVALSCCNPVDVTGVIGDDGGFGLVMIAFDSQEPAPELSIAELTFGRGDEVEIHTLFPMRIEGHFGVGTSSARVLGEREWTGSGTRVRLDIEAQYMIGGLLLNEHEQIVGVITDGAANSRCAASPVMELLRADRHEPVSLVEYEKQQGAMPQVRSRRLYDESRRALASGHHERARELAEEALDLEPQNWLARWGLGVAVDEMGGTNEAIGHFIASIQIEPGYGESHYSLGLCLLKLGLHEDSIAPLDRAIQIMPNHSDAQAMRGLSQWKVGRGNEAISSAIAAIRLDPDRQSFYSNLRIIVSDVRSPDAMEPVLVGLCEELPESVIPRFMLGSFYMQRDDYGDALVVYQEAIDIDPSAEMGTAGAGVCLAFLGRYPEALRVVDTFLDSHPGESIVTTVRDAIVAEMRWAGDG